MKKSMRDTMGEGMELKRDIDILRAAGKCWLHGESVSENPIYFRRRLARYSLGIIPVSLLINILK